MLSFAYERTANVRQVKVSLLVAEYETFKMKEDESTDEMFGEILVNFGPRFDKRILISDNT